jgi:cytochrome o ubiquinol oxidase subunit 3
MKTNSLTLKHQHEVAQVAQTENVKLGFWLYIMSDCLIFASLFATYAVLQGQTFGGPTIKEITNLTFVLKETMVLLLSSFTCGLSILSMQAGRTKSTALWLMLTFGLGLFFLFLELGEFRALYLAGNSWNKSAFLSAYFTLVGTHGLHVAIGSFWMLVLLITLVLRGLTGRMKRNLLILSLFWHFLDIIWIFIFTFVYLIGAL